MKIITVISLWLNST